MLVPVDIETAVIEFLNASMDSDVSDRVSNPRPEDERYGRVTRAGGNPRNLVQSDPRLLLEFWAPDATTAFQDAQRAYGLLWAAQNSYIGDVWVSQIQSTEPVNFPDPDTKSPRYQFVSTLTTSLQEVAP